MRFKLDGTEITCLPDSEFELSGLDSNGKIVNLSSHTLYFNYQPQNEPHADILALICLIVFYPFIKKSKKVIFPIPISKGFSQILKLHQIHAPINVDPFLKSFAESHQGTKNALSWGGGLDTWAAYKLQTNLYHHLIHEEQLESPLPLGPNYPPVTVIQTNQRQIASFDDGTDAGWTSWVGVLVPSLWLAEEFNLSMIGIGGNLGSVFLNNGTQYRPVHLKNNLWHQTFKEMGLPLYMPLAGLTDLGVLKILGPDLDKVKYCWYSTPTGENCHQCLKCIRKEILIGRNVNYVKFPFAGPSFEYLKTNDQKLKKWVFSYYQPALTLVHDETLRNQLKLELERYIELLDEENQYLVEHYGWELD